jgi:Fe-S-cluster-containing dehydrogenase component
MTYDMLSCGGCRTCEMACSYHHTGEFGDSVSSFRVIDKEDSRGAKIEFLEKPEGARPACDRCEGLDVPLCVEWCREADDLMMHLMDFMGERKPCAEKRPEMS